MRFLKHIARKLQEINFKINTKWQYFICKYHNVTIGNNCMFFGLTKFENIEFANIAIGANCRFRSKSTSNLIGINRPCIISTHHENAKIKIGNNCGFSGTVIGCFNSITLGNNVRCGANTLITDSDWHSDDYRVGPSKPIIIEDNVWLGVNSIVMKGVTIGKNSVIGAGSIVTKNIPPNVIAVGNPCVVIKNIVL